MEQQNSEDLLTSMVFGTLEFVPADVGLFRLLAAAQTRDGARPLVWLSASRTTFSFWPWLAERGCIGCEPDLLISVTDDSDQVHLILIEAKYRSGKSSHADDAHELPTDQLARQWDNLVHRCARLGAKPHLVYITDHHGIPVDEIEQAAKEFSSKRLALSKAHPLRCAWLSWAQVGEVFADATSPMLVALRNVVEKCGFNSFHGISAIRPARELWKFDDERFYDWPAFPRLTPWSFVP